MAQGEFYHYPAEVWDEAKCRKVAKTRHVDGYGSAWPYPGLMQASGAAVHYYGLQRFNGGTVIDGEWYEGYVRPYPRLPEGFGYVQRPTWGTFLVDLGNEPDVEDVTADLIAAYEPEDFKND